MTDSKNPWDDEPNLISEEKNGYHFVILRNAHLKTLNGYIGINRQHPWFGKHYDDKKVNDIWVHGGLTFAGKGHDPNAFKKKYWYFGFDTAHAGDLIPSMAEVRLGYTPQLESIFTHDVYRDINYVKEQAESLLGQLQDAKAKRPDYQYNHVREYRKLHKQKLAWR